MVSHHIDWAGVTNEFINYPTDLYQTEKDEFLELLAKQVGRQTKRGQSQPRTKA